MKKKIKYLILTSLTAILLFGTVINVNADECGTCGDNLTYTLDDEGTLIISGTGDMWSYVSWDPSSIKSVIINNGVTSIGNCAFYDCSYLESTAIPDSVTSIGDSAFCYCTGLTSINIPGSVTSIGDCAFQDCTGLTNITIPDSVTDIGAYAFTGCPNLTTAVIGKNAVNLGYWIFEECPLLENVTLRGTVIGPGMFSGGMSNYVGNIKKIVIPDGVTEIPEYAFRGCTKLESIEIPETVTKIGGQAFDGCYSLTEIVIPEGVTELNGWTFRECSKLESITLPGTITRISSAFEKCNDIKNIYFAGTKEEWSKFSSYYYFEKATVTFILKYTFEANGGSAVSSVTKEVAESPVTTCEGKTFLGWYDNAECSGTAITFPYSGEKTTLYAKWGAKVTFVGDLADEETVACGQDISLPTPPTGYTYSFTANGEKWDGTNVTENITVTVTKIPNKYTVTYVGDYAGTDVVNYSENATLPTPPEGYAYKFTVNGDPWDGTNITSEVTVTVTKLHDKCEIVDITDCYGIEVNSDILTVSTYFGTIGCDGISVSEGAAAKVYTNSACSGNPITDINTTGSSTTTVYVVVTAESGRSVTYTAKLTRTPVTSLGKIEFTKATGGHITLRFKDPVPGNPKILVATSKDGTNYTYSEAEYDPEERLIQLSGLEEQTNYFVKAAADYRDDAVTYPESGVIELTTGKTMSTACNITNIISPSDCVFDSQSGTIAATVANSYSEYQVRVEVSTDATWGLYLTPSAKTPIPENKLTLLEGRTTTAYIKVVAEDTDFTKTYTVNIYRQRKSAMPEISVVDGKVNITAPEGSTILYTTDKRDPIPGSYGETYTRAFTAEIGTVIKAIALNPNVEEYSDIAIFRILPDTAVIIDKLYVYLSGKNVDFSYYLMANNESDLCGTFYLAAYNNDNRLVGLYKEDVDKNDSEYNLISGMTVNETPAYFKAFFWDGIKPLRKNVTKDIPQ